MTTTTQPDERHVARRHRMPPPLLVPALRVNDLLFITEYLKNGRNGTHAYRAAHPRAKYTSAAVCAARVLGKVHIQQEIARRLQIEGGITRELVQSDLLLARAWAQEKKDYAALADIMMDCAKLAGFLVERREVKTVDDTTRSTLRELVQSALTPVASSVPALT